MTARQLPIDPLQDPRIRGRPRGLDARGNLLVKAAPVRALAKGSAFASSGKLTAISKNAVAAEIVPRAVRAMRGKASSRKACWPEELRLSYVAA